MFGMTTRQPPCDNARLVSQPAMSSPSEPQDLSATQRWVRPGVNADAPALDVWLMGRAPLPVPEMRARRLSLEALLEQGGHGICLLGGTNAVHATFDCLLPVTLIHSLSTGGRVAMVAEWCPPAALPALWLGLCCTVLADWCRAHGIRRICMAPGVVSDAGMAPEGFQPDPTGLWVRNLVPTPKQLG